MSWSVLQSNSVTKTATATTWSLAYTGNVTSGTVLLVAIGQSGTGTISSVKDGSNNSFTQIGVINLNNNNSHGECALYALATPSGDVGTAPTITVTFSASVVGSLWVGEVSGIQAVTDGTAATAFGAAGACTPSYSDTAGSEFFITVFGDDGGPETSSVTGGWTVDSKSVNNNNDANIVVAYGNSVNGTETNAWTSTGTTTFCGAVAVSFKLTSGGATAAQPLIITAPRQPSPTTPVIAPQLLPVPGNLAPAFTDAGTGSDSLSISTTLTDTGTGSDSLTVTPWIPQPFTVRLTPPPIPVLPPRLVPIASAIPISLTDAGTGSDALAVNVQLSDSGTGSDALATVQTSFLLALAAAIPLVPFVPVAPIPIVIPVAMIYIALADAGSGSDALSVTATVPLADFGAGTDVLSVSFTGQTSALVLTPPRPLPALPPILPQLVPLTSAMAILLTDAGTGSDTLAVTVLTADSGAGSDTLAPAMIVSDTGTGTDSTVIGVVLADAAAGADTVGEAVPLAEAGTGTDVLTIAVAFTDTAVGVDVLVLTAVSVAAADAGTGVDILVLAVTLADAGSGTDTLFVPPPGSTGQVKWQAGSFSPRWQARPMRPRWAGAPFGPRWRVVLLNAFAPIAALSLQEVNVLWTSDLAGTVIDPTVTPLVVQMAFPVSSGNVNAPAQPVTWYAASWLAGTTIKGYVAQCLVGPGGVVTLTAGQSYDVWSKIQGSPEIPAVFAGPQAVY